MKYNKSKLEEWVSVMPKACGIFLENFFVSCREDASVALANYTRDLFSYSSNHPSIKINTNRLMEAFYDISGLRAEDK